VTAQAYGTVGYARRARVTELRGFGSEIVSWKRLDTSIGLGAQEDVQTLWAADVDNISENHQKDPKVATAEFIAALPRRDQKH
jgi:hypothetical protein